jgi:hypothetical protein
MEGRLTGPIACVRLLPKVKIEMIKLKVSQAYYYAYFYTGVSRAWEAGHGD